MPTDVVLVTTPALEIGAGGLVGETTSNIIQFSQRFVRTADGKGERLQTVTITLANRNRVPQQTLGPVAPNTTLPALFAIDWFVETTGELGADDFVYTITRGLDLDAFSYPADHVIVTLSAIGVSGQQYTFDVVVPFSGQGSFAAEAGFEPYGTLAEATRFFQSRIEGRQWEQWAPRDQFALLCSGSDDLDTEIYKGQKRYFTGSIPLQDQVPQKWANRAFPRILPEFTFADLHLTAGNSNDVPHAIKRATFLQALYLGRRFLVDGVDPNERRDLQRSGLTSFSVSTQENWDLARASRDRICAAAFDCIRPFLATSVQQGFID